MTTSEVSTLASRDLKSDLEVIFDTPAFDLPHDLSPIRLMLEAKTISERAAHSMLEARFISDEAAHTKEVARLQDTSHQPGKELGHQAVAYLFGSGDSHEIDFLIGHDNPQTAESERILHEGYAAHLGYLASQGAISPNDEAGLFVAYGTGRIIHKILDQPGVITYRDGNSQRNWEIANNSPKRLFAGA